MRTISIPSGATLSGLAKKYGTTTNELMSLNPTIKNPDEIFAGATLNLPTLAGTLETGGEKEKTLPTPPIDKLSMFGDVLKMVTQRAAKEATARGGEALPEGMLKPEQVSGGTFANVLNLVSKQKTRGIADIYQSTTKMIEDSRKRAKDQFEMLVETGAIGLLEDKELEDLSLAVDIPLEQLKAYQSVMKTDDAMASAYSKAVQNGRMKIESVPSEHRDNVIQKIDWEKIPSIGYEFDSSDKGRLLASGLTNMDIFNLENDISEYGIEATMKGLNEEQKKVAMQILKGFTPTQVIKEKEKLEEEKMISLDDSKLPVLIEALKSKIKSGKVSRSLIQTTIDSGKITSGGKKYSLTPEQQTKIHKEIKSFWQTIIPGGR